MALKEITKDLNIKDFYKFLVDDKVLSKNDKDTLIFDYLKRVNIEDDNDSMNPLLIGEARMYCGSTRAYTHEPTHTITPPPSTR